MTPFEAVYGRKPPTFGRVVQGETRVEAAETELLEYLQIGVVGEVALAM